MTHSKEEREVIRNYLESLKIGDCKNTRGFPAWCKFFSIKHKEESRFFYFNYDNWFHEQKKFQYKKTNRSTVLKPRRVGFSTMELARDLYFALRTEGSTTMIVAQDKETADEFKSTLDTAIDNLVVLSKQFNFPFVPERVTNNSTTIEFRGDGEIYPRKSKIVVDWSKQKKSQANKAGRGKSIDRLHCTEVAFWEFPEETITSLFEAAQKAKQIVIESTPNGKNWFYDWVQKTSLSDSKWSFHFFPWFEHPEYRAEHLPLNFDSRPRNAVEKKLIEWHKINDHQLQWWRHKVEDIGLVKAIQEYPKDPESCFSAVKGSVIDDDERDWLMSCVVEPIEIRDVRGFQQRIWKTDPSHGHKYIIGADVSFGREGDYSSYYVIDSWDGNIVESYANNVIKPNEFGRLLVQRAKHWGNALLAIEESGPGRGCIDFITSNMKYFNLYRPDGKEDFGFYTTSKTRGQLHNLMKSLVTERDIPICDRALHSEMLELRFHGGKIDHPKGAHDDRVMAYLIAQLVRVNNPVMTMQSTILPSPNNQGDSVSTSFGTFHHGFFGKL